MGVIMNNKRYLSYCLLILSIAFSFTNAFATKSWPSVKPKIDPFLKKFEDVSPEPFFNGSKSKINNFETTTIQFLALLNENPNILYDIKFSQLPSFLRAVIRACMANQEIMQLLLEQQTLTLKLQVLLEIIEKNEGSYYDEIIFEKMLYTKKTVTSEIMETFFRKTSNLITLCDLISTLIQWAKKIYDLDINSENEELVERLEELKTKCTKRIVIIMKRFFYKKSMEYNFLVAKTQDPSHPLYYQGGKDSGAGKVILETHEEIISSFQDIMEQKTPEFSYVVF